MAAVRQAEEMQELEHRTHTKWDGDGNVVTALVETVERPAFASRDNFKAKGQYEEEQGAEEQEYIAAGLDDEACSPMAAAIEDIGAMGGATQWRGTHIVSIRNLRQWLRPSVWCLTL